MCAKKEKNNEKSESPNLRVQFSFPLMLPSPSLASTSTSLLSRKASIIEKHLTVGHLCHLQLFLIFVICVTICSRKSSGVRDLTDMTPLASILLCFMTVFVGAAASLTYFSIQDEEYACNYMAAAIPRLKSYPCELFAVITIFSWCD